MDVSEFKNPWTIVYADKERLDYACYAPIEVPEDIPGEDRPTWVYQKFSEIFCKTFGDSADFIILDIYPGYERKEPHIRK